MVLRQKAVRSEIGYMAEGRPLGAAAGDVSLTARAGLEAASARKRREEEVRMRERKAGALAPSRLGLWRARSGFQTRPDMDGAHAPHLAKDLHPIWGSRLRASACAP